MAIQSWWATGCSTHAWAQRLGSCPTSFLTGKRESLPLRTWRSGQNTRSKCRRLMASGQDRGASQFTGEPESQVRNLLCFLSSVSCTFALLYLLEWFYNNADLWINYHGCPQEHFIALRLLYCPRVLMEFAFMIQLTLYLLKFLMRNKNRWDHFWHTVREYAYKITVDSITQIINETYLSSTFDSRL